MEYQKNEMKLNLKGNGYYMYNISFIFVQKQISILNFKYFAPQFHKIYMKMENRKISNTPKKQNYSTEVFKKYLLYI